jgi:hypothetical protein
MLVIFFSDLNQKSFSLTGHGATPLCSWSLGKARDNLLGHEKPREAGDDRPCFATADGLPAAKCEIEI